MDYMIMLSSMCFVISIFTLLLDFKNKKTKISLFAMEISAFLLLIFDRYCYLYKGDVSTRGYWMVRIANFMVFISMLAEMLSYCSYIISVIPNYRKKRLLRLIQILLSLGIVNVIISQFTGWFYTFDSNNVYTRGNLFILSYVPPTLSMILVVIVILRVFKELSKRLRITILVFPILFFIGGIIQLFTVGVSINTLCCGSLVIVFFISALIDFNINVKQARNLELETLKNESKEMHDLFAQTVEALAGAIDAKDKYTHGHSTRVAEYSQKIARMDGKSEEECEEIYFAGMLHDVGKIGIPDTIINKDGKLTDEEFAEIKKHPVVGSEILSKITKREYIHIGARYHHERYDGKGYPEQLQGENIPELARIIAVADAYDAMTSRRSYRDPIPQAKVREEILKGLGTQFDSKFGKYMIQLIDMDNLYTMKEKEITANLDGESELICKGYREQYSPGVLIAGNYSTISFDYIPDDKNAISYPSLVLFDSLEGRMYKYENEINKIDYYEYGTIHLNGVVESENLRQYQLKTIKNAASVRDKYHYSVQAVRYKDHLFVIIENDDSKFELTLALPDNNQFTYFAITGQNCKISNIIIEKETNYIDENHITRITEPINYLGNEPAGDLPNIQIDGWRQAHSKAIPVESPFSIVFNYKVLPFAKRLWHCPSIVLFTSENQLPFSESYIEYASVRLNGENWNENEHAINRIDVIKKRDFVSWDEWKTRGKSGQTCRVFVEKQVGKIIVSMESNGLMITNTTILKDTPKQMYLSITGDQCTVTNIKIY